MNGPRFNIISLSSLLYTGFILSGCNFIKVVYTFGVSFKGFAISCYQGLTISGGWRALAFGDGHLPVLIS